MCYYDNYDAPSDPFDHDYSNECSDCDDNYYLFQQAKECLDKVIRILYGKDSIDTGILHDCLSEAYDVICKGSHDYSAFPKNEPEIARSKNAINSLKEMVQQLNLARAI